MEDKRSYKVKEMEAPRPNRDPSKIVLLNKFTESTELKDTFKKARKEFIAVVKFYKEMKGRGDKTGTGAEELSDLVKSLHNDWTHFESVWPILEIAGTKPQELDIIAITNKMENIEKEIDKFLGATEPWKGYFGTMNKFRVRIFDHCYDHL